MESNKQYRFKDNPKEYEFYQKFKEMFDSNNGEVNLSAIVFGWANSSQDYPKRYLSEDEINICITLIQWLGSHVGQCFLESCGFEQKQSNNKR